MKESTNFFERLTQLYELKGFKSLNDFAKNGLGYASSEKLNRLRDASKNPSIDIVLDITNKFEQIDTDWLLTGKGEMLKEPKTYTQQRLKLKNSPEAGFFPVFSGNTRLREDPTLQVYSDDRDMQTPIAQLPKSAFPGCDHGERAFGNSMYPRLVNQGWAIGKIIEEKSKIIYNEMYGIHVKGGGPPIVKYVQGSDKGDCIKLVSENKSLGTQDLCFDDITFIFRVLYIINPA
jgi:hypothetical protein